MRGPLRAGAQESLPNLIAWFERAISRPCFKATSWERLVRAVSAA
jgi:hypothetical protein